MPELKDSTIFVQFDGDKGSTKDANGEQKSGTSNVEDWSIQSSYIQSTDGFEITLIADNLDDLRDLECQPITLFVNGAPQLIGRIDQTIRGERGSSITCSGRDYLADLVECNIDPTFTVKEGETLGSVILRAASTVGITKVADGSDIALARNVRTGKAVGGPGQPPNFIELKQEELKPDPGQGIYEFLKKICERHGCTIQPDTSRNSLLIAGPFYKQDVAYKLTRTRAATLANNIDTATATRDYSSFPSLVIVQGHGSPRHGEATKSDQAVIDTWSEAQHFSRTGDNQASTVDVGDRVITGTGDTSGNSGQGELGRILNNVTWSGRRKPNGNEGDLIGQHKIYRLNHFRDNQARNATQLQKAAQKLLGEHLKNTLIYEVTVHGHIDPISGAVWSIDTIIDVNDDICDVHEPLWVMERKLTFGSNGAKTIMKCIRPGSFEI